MHRSAARDPVECALPVMPRLRGRCHQLPHIARAQSPMKSAPAFPGSSGEGPKEIRRSGTRRNGVDGDLTRTEFPRHVAGQDLDGSFAGRVDEAATGSTPTARRNASAKMSQVWLTSGRSVTSASAATGRSSMWTTGPPRRSSSAALPRRAFPRPGPLRHVRPVRSARRPLELRAGVAGRHVLCAVPLGHPTPTVAPPAEPTADPSPSPSCDTATSFSPKPLPRTRAVITTISTCFAYP
jgi:hypothetical protein